jgi:hypothetical protein
MAIAHVATSPMIASFEKGRWDSASRSSRYADGGSGRKASPVVAAPDVRKSRTSIVPSNSMDGHEGVLIYPSRHQSVNDRPVVCPSVRLWRTPNKFRNGFGVL